MDVYSATPAEEAAWAKEIVASVLSIIHNDRDAIRIKFATDNLAFHHWPGLEALLISKLNDDHPARQIAFASLLWNLYKYRGVLLLSYKILYITGQLV